MSTGMDDEMRFPDLLRDPLIRLMMERDGVTEQEVIALMGELDRVLAVRETHPVRRRSATV
jgi:hypothetical protein